MNKIVATIMTISLMFLLVTSTIATGFASAVSVPSNSIDKEDLSNSQILIDAEEGVIVDQETETVEEETSEAQIITPIKPIIAPTSFLNVELTPERQSTKNGDASYKIIVTDMHTQSPNTRDNIGYAYEIAFNAKSDSVKAKLEQTNFILSAGETKSIGLEVSAEDSGSYVFSVVVRGNGGIARTKGLLLYAKTLDPVVRPTAYFVGQGFAIKDDESKGYLVDLNILEDDKTLKGKMTMNSERFRIEGTLRANNVVSVTLYNVKTGSPVGTLFGEIKELNDFKILKGDLAFAHDDWTLSDWKLTVISKKNKVFREITPINKPESTSIEEVITVKKSASARNEIAIDDESEDATYIRPVKIKRAKWFGFIPTPFGKKVLEVEVIEDGIVTKTEVSEFSSQSIGKYTVEVGSLDNEEDFDLSVAETE